MRISAIRRQYTGLEPQEDSQLSVSSRKRLIQYGATNAIQFVWNYIQSETFHPADTYITESTLN